MAKHQASQAISASWIIPALPENTIFEDCTLIVNQQRIENIVPTHQFLQDYEVEEHIDLQGQALLPGLINAHCHAAMSLFRGYADDLPLMTWLQEHIWPAESRWVDEEFVKTGTELAIAEMLMSGTTCFSDMYFFPEVSARVAHDTGIRAQITSPVIDFPTNWSAGAEDCISKGLTLRDDYRSNERVNIVFGPHAPYSVNQDALSTIATYAEETETPVQIHLHETAFEIEQALADKGERPIQSLAKLGLLSPLLQCVHMTQASDDDIAMLAEHGAHVIHCPDSNLKLASGICPTAKLLAKGINVALGTDGSASNNDLNLFEEMQHAALLAKVDSGDASAVDAHTAIRMATINGARAMGIDTDTGSLQVGKLADICAVDLRALNMQPIYNPASQIVYAGAGNRVSNVWVAGKRLLRDGALTTLSTDNILQAAKHWQEKIAHG